MVEAYEIFRQILVSIKQAVESDNKEEALKKLDQILKFMKEVNIEVFECG